MTRARIDEDENARLLRIFGTRLNVSVHCAADALDCGISHIYKLLDTHELSSHLVAGRRKIDVKDILAFYARQRATPAPMKKMPWDQNGVAPRRYWPRREDGAGTPKRQHAEAKAAQPKRRPGRPRKDEAEAKPRRRVLAPAE